ncbi:hypothetical protein QBC41DRAFT_315706 [Cercophora samala]|uniref:Uncharacterized protein n=1 Tax=Cercophora samala TaxID=330535 RepID=A0AA39ZI64_9PEZI|nr:hypothetical protein QBC41DRAFT_315706 [Cercophora samala]
MASTAASFSLSYFSNYLMSALPDPVAKELQAVFAPGSQFRRELGSFGDWISDAVNNQFWPSVEPAMNRLAGFFHHSPEMVSALVALATLVAVIQIVRLASRVVRFWTRVAMRLAFWSVVFMLVSIVWNRGLEQTIRDLVLLGTGLYRWGERAGQVFWDEYEKAQLNADRNGW